MGKHVIGESFLDDELQKLQSRLSIRPSLIKFKLNHSYEQRFAFYRKVDSQAPPIPSGLEEDQDYMVCYRIIYLNATLESSCYSQPIEPSAKAITQKIIEKSPNSLDISIIENFEDEPFIGNFSQLVPFYADQSINFYAYINYPHSSFSALWESLCNIGNKKLEVEISIRIPTEQQSVTAEMEDADPYFLINTIENLPIDLFRYTLTQSL